MLAMASGIRNLYVPVTHRARAAKTGAAVLDAAILWAMSLFAFLLPTDLRLAEEKSIAMRVGYVCLLLGIVGLWRRRAFVLPRNGLWLLAGFVAWSSCSLAWAQFPEAALHKVLLYVMVLAVTAMIPQYAWDLRVRARLIDAYLAGCGLGIVGTLVNFALGNAYVHPGEPELEGRYSFGTDPNYLALALVIGIPLALRRSSLARSRWSRSLALLYVPAAVTGMLLTGSRGALLALLAAILVYTLFTGLRALGLLLASASLCLSIGVLLPGEISDRFAGIPDELRHGSLADRRDLWDRGTAVVAEHPFEGIGAGASTGLFDIAAHNTPLELMMEGGAVSLGLFYGALILGVWNARNADRNESRALIAAWAAWLVGTFSLSWEINTITWFMFALLFSAGSPRCAVAISMPVARHEPRQA